MRKFIFNLYISLILFVTYTKCIEFFFNINQYTEKCLGEYLTEQTTGNRLNLFLFSLFMNLKILAIFHTRSEKTFTAKLYDPNGVVVYEKVKQINSNL